MREIMLSMENAVRCERACQSSHVSGFSKLQPKFGNMALWHRLRAAHRMNILAYHFRTPHPHSDDPISPSLFFLVTTVPPLPLLPRAILEIQLGIHADALRRPSYARVSRCEGGAPKRLAPILKFGGFVDMGTCPMFYMLARTGKQGGRPRARRVAALIVMGALASCATAGGEERVCAYRCACACVQRSPTGRVADRGTNCTGGQLS
jgi:hypothetical protein